MIVTMAHLPLGAVVTAMESWVLIRFSYDDGLELRTVEPFLVGRTRTDDLLLLCWQLSGPSSSPHKQGWRHFRIEKLSSIAVTDTPFHPDREGYHRASADWEEVFAET